MLVSFALLEGIGLATRPLLGEVTPLQIGSAIVSNVWKWWSKRKEAKERRAELEALAQATGTEVRKAVKEVVEKVAGDRSAAERARLEAYLLAVPAQLRRTLRRPSDTTGRTIPADLVLGREEDLVPFLPARPPHFVADARVADFKLVELLGVGGFGEVWKAKNTFMSGAPPVALKFCVDPVAAKSLRNETELLDRIQSEGRHPGIVQLRHTFLSADPPFLEYELIEGGDLGGLIVEWHRQRGGPTPAQAARVMYRLAEIVAFAHQLGITHRDLKPANILVQGDVTSSLKLKIADFGIGAITADTASRVARSTGALSTRTAADVCGGYSPYYASPEQMRGAPPDPRDDVHALGVIWYQLLVGDLKAEAPRGTAWKKRLAAKGMSAELIECLESCMASEQEERPDNAAAVSAQIGPPTRGSAPPPPPPVRPEPEPTPPPPNPGVHAALLRAREDEYRSRLRELQFGHRRLQWARTLPSWLLPLLLVVGSAFAGGGYTYGLLHDRTINANHKTGNRLAIQYSTPDKIIRYSESSGRLEWYEYRYYYTQDANSAVAKANREFDLQKQSGDGDGVVGVLVGCVAFVALLGGFLVLRRWKRNGLATAMEELAQRTQTEYEHILQDWPEAVDLNQPADVERMLAVMELAGTIRRPWKGPSWLFHRFFAPF